MHRKILKYLYFIAIPWGFQLTFRFHFLSHFSFVNIKNNFWVKKRKHFSNRINNLNSVTVIRLTFIIVVNSFFSPHITIHLVYLSPQQHFQMLSRLNLQSSFKYRPVNLYNMDNERVNSLFYQIKKVENMKNVNKVAAMST